MDQATGVLVAQIPPGFGQWDELLSLILGLPESVHAPLLVGHNPGLERLIVELTRDDVGGLRRRVAGKFPTAGLAVIELPADRWPGIAPGNLDDIFTTIGSSL